MKRQLDLKKSIFDLSKDNPEIVEIMYELGFKDIKSPAMLSTAGRFMTIPKGAQMKGLNLDTIKKAFEEKGFEII